MTNDYLALKVTKDASVESLESWLYMPKIKPKSTRTLTDAKLLQNAGYLIKWKCQLL